MKSAFAQLNPVEVSNSDNNVSKRFERVAGSSACFSAKELQCITKCVLRTTTSLSGKSQLTLLLEWDFRGKHYRLWVKLDSISYKRYHDSVNCSIDPSKVAIYKLHDPEKEYGKPENGYTWQVCRIKKDAIVTDPLDDEAIFGDVPF